MKIGFIGSGNAGQMLGRALVQLGHDVRSRTSKLEHGMEIYRYLGSTK